MGCGEYPLGDGWTNLDSDPDVKPDVVATVPPLPYGDGALEEIYAGHFLEHLPLEGAQEFLAECHRCLEPGGRIGIVVPDIYEIARRYVNRMVDAVYIGEFWWNVADLDAVNSVFLYSSSSVQKSPHRWAYDIRTLHRAMTQAGFGELTEIDRYRDPRLGSGAWYQCGLEGVRQ